MVYAQLLWVYLKIGLFGFGGGYAMLSLIRHEVVEKYGWISNQEFTDIIAVSQMTPGPIGINSATYIGYTVTGNVFGSIVATAAVCLPSFALVLLIAGIFARIHKNRYVEGAMSSLRLVVVGLIASAALLLLNKENFTDTGSVIIFIIAFLLTVYYKLHPILLIALAGIAGIIIY
jgi:chromate transporter